jgi:hypothetical protein
LKELFAPPRPDHIPPENLDGDALAQSIDSLRRKLHSVRRSLRTARLAGAALLLTIVTGGFALLWAGPDPFLERIFQSGDAVTVPELLAWWVAVIGASLFGGIVGARLFQHRLRVVRAWRHRADELERRLKDAEAEERHRS